MKSNIFLQEIVTMPSAGSTFAATSTKTWLAKITTFFSQDIVIRIFETTKALNFENSFLLYCGILIMRFN